MSACWRIDRLYFALALAQTPGASQAARPRRRPCPGESEAFVRMLHQGGSRHVWIEGLPAIDRIDTIDDATNEFFSSSSSNCI